MDDDQIKEMLSEIFKEVDVDLWRDLFSETDDAEEMMERLLAIARDHLEAANID